MSDSEPQLSVIVLAWDQLHLTEACVDSLRRHTDVPFELIVVDNGSGDDAREFARVSADVAVLLSSNLGFAGGMNAGLAEASAPAVVFANNDTVFPPDWAAPLLDTLAAHPSAAVVAPAVTAAANPRTVRRRPGGAVEVLQPFSPVPAAVVWLMPTDVVRGLGGFDERFHPAAGEDLDLAFKVWVNDLDIVFDPRVLIDHVGKGTAAVKLPNWRATWRENGDRMLARWADLDDPVPALPGVDAARLARNRRTAAAVAGWMARYYAHRRRRVPGRLLIERALAWWARRRSRVHARARRRPGANA